MGHQENFQNLEFGDVDGAVARGDGESAAAGVEFAMDARFGKRAGDGDGEIESDVAVAGVSVEIGIEVRRDFQINVAIAGMEGPSVGNF